MADNNRIHVSPGIYSTTSVDMKAAAKSLGVTKLALVGETPRGAAFQPYWVHSPKDYADMFGGTSTKKFAGSGYPQYELPYIAKEFLKAGTELCVVRTLGFSGYNAGPAWLITGYKNGDNSGKKYVIAVLRSRGKYGYRAEFSKVSDSNGCPCQSAYDSMTYDVGELSSVASCSAPISYNMDAVKLAQYKSINSSGSECDGYDLSGEAVGYDASYGNFGRFTIRCIVGTSNEGDTPSSVDQSRVVNIPVSLNKADKDFILKVLGTTNDDGDQPLFVESLYDVAWEELVTNDGFDKISAELATFDVAYAADYGGLASITGILTRYEDELTRKDIGKRYLYAGDVSNGSPKGIKAYMFNYNTNQPIKLNIPVTLKMTENQARNSNVVIEIGGGFEITDGKYAGQYINNSSEDAELRQLMTSTTFGGNSDEYFVKKADGLYAFQSDACEEGHIYTVAQITDSVGKRHYVYKAYTEESTQGITDASEKLMAQDKLLTASETTAESKRGMIVYNYEDGLFYKKTTKVIPVLCDLNDYKSQYRYSSTPWVVSNAKGDADNIVVNKMFRFHTISDGNSSVGEIKVSIENIRPDSGEFDVVVRSFGDIDSSPAVLERFVKCTMTSGNKFIGYKIGTIDGQYESKSKYITVEVAESSAARNSIPAGFMGYSIPRYDAATIDGVGHSNVFMAPITYNTEYNEDVAKRRQYFGISDRVGYDVDYFTYKGKMATLEDPDFCSHGFHLDCRLGANSYGSNAEGPKISVDGVSGYVFDTVSVNARTSKLSDAPIIASEDEMVGCIYEDIKLRKFTMAFAGGFDGWDIYRDMRTNTDEYSYNNYKGYINKSTGVGYAFNSHSDAGSYGIEGGAITSDYYSVLAGVSLLKNPEAVDINVLATPGIDTINNTSLVNEIFDIMEERTDTLYIPTTPDKEIGSGDYADDIAPVDEIVPDFEDKDLNSDYATTYYPWVKIEDNGEYIWLPVTKDVVRNLAESDNTNTTMNLAPAGTTRGKVDAIRARKNLLNGEADTLYEANLNPVRTYSQEGIVIMGQKTLRAEDDLLNRVDVMRMTMRLRKLIAIGCLGLIFEPNDAGVVKDFRSIINGIMQTFIDNRAVKKWYMNVDASEESLERREIGATLYVMPVGALEYIRLNLIVTNNDVYFES